MQYFSHVCWWFCIRRAAEKKTREADFEGKSVAEFVKTEGTRLLQKASLGARGVAEDRRSRVTRLCLAQQFFSPPICTDMQHVFI